MAPIHHRPAGGEAAVPPAQPAPRAVPPAVRAQLHAPEPAERIRAVRGLAPYGQNAVEPLFAMLTDPEPSVRWAALGTLNSLQHADLVPPILAALPSADERMQVRLYFLLARHADRRTWDTLVAGLGHTDKNVRQVCADGLTRTAQPGDEAVLGKALATASPAVALGLVQALAPLGTPEAAAALAPLLQHEDATYRQYGAQGLAELGRPEAVAYLTQHLHDSSAEVRSWVYYGISQHGDGSTFDILLAGTADPDAYIRKESAWGLGRLADARALSALQGALTDEEPTVRGSAAEALGMLNHPAALPDLQRAAADPDPTVRLLAAESLLRLGDASGTAELIENLRHDNRHFRRVALRGLTLYSGQAFGGDYDAWKAWWAAQSATPVPPPAGQE